MDDSRVARALAGGHLWKKGKSGGSPRSRIERSRAATERSVRRTIAGFATVKFGLLVGRREVTQMLEWLAAALDFIEGLFNAETQSWG
jgi:hypothetical protein